MSKPTNFVFTSGDADAIRSDNSGRRFFPVVDNKQVRRPAVLPLANRLQKENPHWSADQCLAEAKRRITNKC